MEGLRETLEFWHEEILEKHFKESAYSRYKYTARARSYVKRKRKRLGHNRPLVYSGNTRRQLMRARRLNVRSAKKAKLIMTAPAHVNYRTTRRSSARSIDKKAEITALIGKEMKKLEKTMDRVVGELLKQPGNITETERMK